MTDINSFVQSYLNKQKEDAEGRKRAVAQQEEAAERARIETHKQACALAELMGLHPDVLSADNRYMIDANLQLVFRHVERKDDRRYAAHPVYVFSIELAYVGEHRQTLINCANKRRPLCDYFRGGIWHTITQVYKFNNRFDSDEKIISTWVPFIGETIYKLQTLIPTIPTEFENSMRNAAKDALEKGKIKREKIENEKEMRATWEHEALEQEQREQRIAAEREQNRLHNLAQLAKLRAENPAIDMREILRELLAEMLPAMVESLVSMEY